MAQLLGNKRLKLGLLLGSLAALGPLTIDMYLPSFPTITAEFSTHASLVQFSLTASLLGLGIGQLIIGPVSDVLGRRLPLIIFLFIYFVASSAIAFSPTIYFFIGVRFIQGFSAAGGIVISRAIARDIYEGRALTEFFALLILISNLAPILAPVLGSTILLFTNWRGVFIVLGVIGFVLTLIMALRLKETLSPQDRVPSNIRQVFKNFLSLIKDRQFIGYGLTQGFVASGIFAYVSGTPFVYQNIYGTSPQVFSLLFGINGIGIMTGTLLIGRFSYIISETVFLKTGLLMAFSSGLTLFIVVLSNGPLFAVVIPIFVFVTSMGFISTSSFSLAMQEQGHIAGSAAALLGVLPFILGSITAPLVGIAGENTAIPMGTIIFLGSIMSVISFYTLVEKNKKTVNH